MVGARVWQRPRLKGTNLGYQRGFFPLKYMYNIGAKVGRPARNIGKDVLVEMSSLVSKGHRSENVE